MNLSHRVTVCLALLFALGLTPLVAQDIHHHGFEAANYDARIEYNQSFEAAPSLDPRSGIEALHRQLPGLDVLTSRTTGAVRSLYNRAGYLTEARPDADPRTIALDYLQTSGRLLGLDASDLASAEIVDAVPSISGTTHFYLRQTHRDLPVYGAQLQIHVNRDGRVQSVNSSFLPRLATHAPAIAPRVGAREALGRAASHLGFEASPRILHREGSNPQRTTFLQLSDDFPELAEAELVWLPIRRGDVRLAWKLRVPARDGEHSYEMTLDADSGQVWTRFDSRDGASYRVYKAPIESPIHTTPLPPSDARTLVNDPEDATASPLGWHDDGTTSFTTTQGNNVKAFIDGSNQTDCGSGLSCDFSLDLSQDPSFSQDAAVASAFYWANHIHDIHYHYGFDEASGNFQENNFGNGGLGGDSVDVKVQYSGNCNAHFDKEVDGTNPAIRLYLCDKGSPKLDSAFDAGVLVHEYAHGISHRLVGGPSNVSCLSNTQRPSEGWSDWFALAYTAEAGDQGTDKRGIASYFFDKAADDSIRSQPYSTDPALNTMTFGSMDGGSSPYDQGTVWAQALWEVYWALVDTHGFESNLDVFNLGGPNEAGNKRALFYVTEGLKRTTCSPSLIDARTGILLAAQDNFGGADLCLIWEAFANFGLGYDASTDGGGTMTATDGFAMPPECPTVFTSVASEDGWIRESHSNSNIGGAMSATATNQGAIRAGDSSTDRQYRSIVSFDTSAIADGSKVQSATLRLRRGKIVGQDPFDGSFGPLRVSIRKNGFSGDTALELSDFQAQAHANTIGSMSIPAADLDWSEGSLSPGGLNTINDTGTTQFRVFFATGDDGDATADYIGFYSADNSDSDRHPQLVVSYLP